MEGGKCAMMLAGDDGAGMFDPRMETHAGGTTGGAELELDLQARVPRDRFATSRLNQAGVTSRRVLRHCVNGPGQILCFLNADIQSPGYPIEDIPSSAQ